MFRAITMVILAASSFVSQVPAVTPLPRFEVASIKPSLPSPDGRITATIGGDAGRIDYEGLPLKMLLSRAFEVKDDQISGPDWLDTARFDIIAKLPDGAPRDQVPAMLQALLVERFKISLHHDKKELGIYALVTGKNGPRLKDATSAGAGKLFIRTGHIEMQGNLSSFADFLSRMVDRPVFDMTGLKASYDILLNWTPDLGQGSIFKGFPATSPAAGPENPGPTLFTAIEEQLGLKLEARKAPVDIVVIDHVEKTPAEE
jgi:uncharacterized protein (TIGR03435 family)